LLALLIVIIFLKKRGVVLKYLENIPNGVKVTVFCFLILSFISSYLNEIPIIVAIFSLRWLFVIFGTIFVFYAIYNDGDIFYFLRLVVIIGLLQTPITLYQRIFEVFIFHFDEGDRVSGLFSQYYTLTIYQVFCIMIVFTLQLKNKKLFQLSYVRTYLLLIIPFVVSNINAAWFYLTFGIIIVLKLSQIRLAKFFKIAGIATLSLIVSVYFFNLLNIISYNDKNETFTRFLNPRVFIEYNLYSYSLEDIADLSLLYESGKTETEMGVEFGRFSAIIYNYYQISKNDYSLYFGLGPVSNIETQEASVDNNSVSFLSSPYILGTSISRILGGFGIVGIVLLVIFFVQLYGWFSKMEASETVRVIRKSFIIVFSLFLIYFNVLQSFQVAFLMGVLTVRNRVNVNNNKLIPQL
jgi:hypothetical protein